MYRKRFQSIVKKLLILISILFLVYFVLQLKIQKVEYQLINDKYHLLNQSAFDKCITTLKGRNFWFFKLSDIKNQVLKCDEWIDDVYVDKRFPNKVQLTIRVFEPKLKIKVKKACFLMSEDLKLHEIKCKSIAGFSSLPLLTTKYPLDGYFDLIEQLFEFNKFCKAYLSMQPEYQLEKYADRIVLVANFKTYKVILNPTDSGSTNFTRFFQAFNGLKKTSIKYHIMILLFDRVIIK